MSFCKLDFMCLGFAKCGTTTLYNILNQHSDIYLSGIKEPVFWNGDARKRGIEWYFHRYYREAKKSQIIGEINPQLTNGKVSLWDVKKCMRNNAKIILMMRNPIERLYSHFFMQLLWRRPEVYNGRNLDLQHHDRLFESYVRGSIYGARRVQGSSQFVLHKGLFVFGDYVNWLRECREVFGSSNVYIIIFEEFMKDKRKQSDQMFGFLGIRKNMDLDYDIKSNEGSFLPRNVMCMDINRLWYFDIWPRICANIDINRVIDNFMDIHLNWNMRGNTLLLNKMKRKSMTEQTRRLLYDLYMPEIKKLEVMLQKTLENIWY